MDFPDYTQRFGALARLYGVSAYDLLPRLHVCIVGLGGVGSWAVEALARSGVGTLTLIDFDTVAASNINRQIQALDSTLGAKKHLVLKTRIGEINPTCQVHCVDDFLTTENLAEYLNPARAYDYVIDAIDSIKFKAAMIHYCRRNKVPILTTGGAGGLTDPTQVQILDLSRTYNDALAAKVRGRLRDDYGFPRAGKRNFGVECVFSSQQPVYLKADGTVSYSKPGIHGVHLDCRFGYGSTAIVTAVFGLTAAGRALDKALQKRLRLATNLAQTSQIEGG